MKLDADILRAISAAVALVSDRLLPEDRFDLRQELSIKLLAVDTVRDVAAWTKTTARNWASDLLRQRKNQREVLRMLAATAGVGGIKSGATWHPPHEDAEEFAPFACEGARLMSVHNSRGTINKKEDSVIAVIDATRRHHGA